jgi:hypothetical protein
MIANEKAFFASSFFITSLLTTMLNEVGDISNLMPVAFISFSSADLFSGVSRMITSSSLAMLAFDKPN